MDLISDWGALALGSRLKRLSDRMMKSVSEIYKSSGVDFESKWFPIFYVLSKEGEKGIMEIAEILNITHPGVIQIAREMEKAGWITSVKSGTDGRKRHLKLTEKAYQNLPQLEEMWVSFKENNEKIIRASQHNILMAMQEIEDFLDKNDFKRQYYETFEEMRQSKIDIQLFDEKYQTQVEDMVLGIQNGEFNLGLTAQRQPDLHNLKAFYNDRGNLLWVATNSKDDVVGTIGLERLNNEQAVLRKMFIKQEYRGKALGLAQRLFEILVLEALKQHFKEILLDTPLVTHAAHRFYERNGFELISNDAVPENYILPKGIELKIYRLKL
ncbi:bifunctional helix-turn-helix transcriptional regulator/GNAT family N-acetyltransferase [Emticicia sp. 21SJ11W-3]|uniref:bifunctional helix-turn-helix transcriptional regulator/GNAT family N-acetyltransferase n=1 Tax=Emticicia sp. 21SJ11W-3 TaxID=2916755 RepID=UPI00209EE527|nr:bifunctional helix-turn-helix transcriptional regulator/GNAT family N-acetyltransferase [Emticicia sp. 21SJ11W-3]UTA69755.1 bifunctional helix-turn-helix transcriptional regulator/GNAT family N-acetyltransferase [Emticicia sp. 21SJ11W-3]